MHEEILLDDGTPARRYEDGSVRVPNGNGGWQYAERPPQAAPLITSANASAFAKRRWALQEEKARARIREQAQEHTGLRELSTPDAVGILAGEAYASSLNNMHDRPREAVTAGKFSLQLAGAMPDSDSKSPVIAIQINVSDAIAERYLDDDDDIIDG